MRLLSTCVALFLGASEALAGTYCISDTFVGRSFLSGFHHQAIPDPSSGRVTYVDQATALKHNLTYADDDTLIIRADHTTKLNSTGPGRESVRIASNKQWTTSVTVVDIRHMPVGCATWPGLRTVADDNPIGEKIDIIEGVNDQGPNQISLHTLGNCTQPAQRSETGTAVSFDCNTHVSGNPGCGVKSDKATSYGPQFNAVGGGWIAMERTSTHISMWYWARTDDPPNDIISGDDNIDPGSWGTPVAHFVNTQCDLDEQFGPNNIVINLTLCGGWAGSTFTSAGCPGTCVDYVNDNPAAFLDAYWEIASLRVYTPEMATR
ncbi:glycoside hydrolase family 16 protein [Botryobasidium botryosum FD-172 SS1]|uniref:Glycoside hydrolase family 16 protein n=1 Tax=Botryobasidium botryosum (strain FD-172 SS1) TaxID=930990 RepID=A0A067M6M0_BOTB1|nr:glycoside hydrolase family 16 protein [Botryobasidium botryosum FD-172 SS1]